MENKRITNRFTKALMDKPTIADLEKVIGTVDEPDILPNGEIRKKIPLAEQPSNNCNCPERPKIHTIECVSKPEQPNTELLIVKTIQGLISAINRELGKLDGMTPNLSHAKPLVIHKALEEIDLFEKTTLYELQKAFE